MVRAELLDQLLDEYKDTIESQIGEFTLIEATFDFREDSDVEVRFRVHTKDHFQPYNVAIYTDGDCDTYTYRESK